MIFLSDTQDIVINTRPDHPSEPSRILQIIPIAKTAGLDPKAKLAEKINQDDSHGMYLPQFQRSLNNHVPQAPLQVTFHGGSYMRQTQKATFLFHCDPTAEVHFPHHRITPNRTDHACTALDAIVPVAVQRHTCVFLEDKTRMSQTANESTPARSWPRPRSPTRPAQRPG